MKTYTKIGGFVLGLVLLFGAAFAIGTTVGPFDSDSDNHHAKQNTKASGQPGGLAISEDGYTLRPVQTPNHAGTQTQLRFTIVDSQDRTVTKFTENHDKELHLILVRRDLAHYQHIHPVMDTDGTWVLPVTVAAAGQYRMFADFQPDGHKRALTLGADFAVAGDYTPIPLPTPSTSTTVDGYEVTLSGELLAGSTSKLTLTVNKNGEPVTDLEPYLGAYGHLVALRDGDVAYLHVHPDGELNDGETKAGPEIVFYAEVPSSGNYRLYLDFKHDGHVRTAEFTATVGGLPDASSPKPEHEEHNGHGG